MANDITVALNENAVNNLVQNLIQGFNYSLSGSTNGNFRVNYNFGINLSGGEIDFQNNPDRIRIKELDINYNPANVTIEVDIPEMCIGGFCIIPRLFGGCLVRAPRICVFSANPDISIPINLDGLITSEISIWARPFFSYFNNPANSGMNDIQAHLAGVPDEWQLFLDNILVDIDVLDIADTVGNIFDSIVDNFIDSAFGWLPNWAQDTLTAILGGIGDVIRTILDLVDDFSEWLTDLLNINIGLWNSLFGAIANYLTGQNALYGIENPFPILPSTNPSIPPVLIDIDDLQVDLTDDELLLCASI